jgi:hypothetical protein
MGTIRDGVPNARNIGGEFSTGKRPTMKNILLVEDDPAVLKSARTFSKARPSSPLMA